MTAAPNAAEPGAPALMLALGPASVGAVLAAASVPASLRVLDRLGWWPCGRLTRSATGWP